MKELHITQSSSSKFFTKLKHSINLKRLLNKNDHFSIKNISLSPLPLEQDRTLGPSESSPFSYWMSRTPLFILQLNQRRDFSRTALFIPTATPLLTLFLCLQGGPSCLCCYNAIHSLKQHFSSIIRLSPLPFCLTIELDSKSNYDMAQVFCKLGCILPVIRRAHHTFINSNSIMLRVVVV